MLKSHIAIRGADDEEIEEEERKNVEGEDENQILVHEVSYERYLNKSETRIRPSFLGKTEVVHEVSYERHLNKSETRIRLSFLGKTADGDGYTYLKATITGMRLTHIDVIKTFQHLQYVDVSENYLRLDELQVVTELPYLVLLQADKNKLDSIELRKMRYLQVLILNNNDISSVQDMFQPELCTLEVGFNHVHTLQFNNAMPHMRCLDFRNNKLTDIANLNFPKLDSLYLANNHITSLVGLGNLVNLRILNVRNNPIRLLDGFHEDLTKLNYVNLRNCKVTTLKQVKKLRALKGIETLILKGCPYMGGTGEEDGAGGDEEDDNELRVEVLASLPRLKRLNKTIVTPEERDEAKTLMLQWVEEGENDEEEIEAEMQHLEEDA